jgi:hypothetical protein
LTIEIDGKLKLLLVVHHLEDARLYFELAELRNKRGRKLHHHKLGKK